MIGGYMLRVFRISDGIVREVPASINAENEFAANHPCRTRGHNVYAIKWSNGGDRMLLGLQVYPTSDCGREMGRYVGYVVQVRDGKSSADILKSS